MAMLRLPLAFQPVEDEVESWWNHLDALKLGPHSPAVVINAKLCPFWYIQEHQSCPLREQAPSQVLIHLPLQLGVDKKRNEFLVPHNIGRGGEIFTNGHVCVCAT